ncbi:hypothetical protein [Cellulophaga sp. L1A9]|uniref:hypothetical protein n=1 Tax=Cellulophaga sp. L1A9 TaxID=2686362 RepID=UPI00131A93B0|nr:hypothetical protein [Cellulophaga sp. L1A9]
MEHFEMNLNVWYYLPDEYLDKLPQIFSKMDGWLGSGGYSIDSGFWYSYSTNGNEKYVCCCDEPSGLHFNAYMKSSEWEKWKKEFKVIASEILGYKVGEPELGDCDSSFGQEYAGN